MTFSQLRTTHDCTLFQKSLMTLKYCHEKSYNCTVDTHIHRNMLPGGAPSTDCSMPAPIVYFPKNIWTTGCISLYCLTDADVGPLRLCFCSVSGTLEFSRLLLSSGPLDSWILDAAQYQQLYKMIISLIFMEQFFSCHSLSLE